ncbi:MAG: hypothetical protein ACJAZO_001396 [Myxococcota bacterium]|jgi:hypothetical protein
MSLFEALSLHWQPNHIALRMGDDILTDLGPLSRTLCYA